MKNRGFSLLELLVALLVLAILTATAIPLLNKYKVRAYNAIALSDLKNLITAQETYYADKDKYIELYYCSSGFVRRGKELPFKCSKDNYVISNGYNNPDYKYFSAYSCNGRGDLTYGYLSEEGEITKTKSNVLRGCKRSFKRLFRKIKRKIRREKRRKKKKSNRRPPIKIKPPITP